MKCTTCGHEEGLHSPLDTFGQTVGCVWHDSEGPCLCPGWANEACVPAVPQTHAYGPNAGRPVEPRPSAARVLFSASFKGSAAEFAQHAAECDARWRTVIEIVQSACIVHRNEAHRAGRTIDAGMWEALLTELGRMRGATGLT